MLNRACCASLETVHNLLTITHPVGVLCLVYGASMNALKRGIRDQVEMGVQPSQFARMFQTDVLARMQVAFDFSGAGILAAIVLGVTTSTLWSKGWPKMLSSGVLPPFVR